jgi:DNA-directed RNA polymerase specialized sigma24 family protein
MLLYPRLRPLEIRPLVAVAGTASLQELEVDCELLPPRVVWPPTGGTRASLAKLQEVRSEVREVAATCGYQRGATERTPITGEQARSFDAALARRLHEVLDLSPHEASDGGVWAWMGLVMAPELVRWRFDATTTRPERFGQNRLRNVFGRCWWRAELLGDPGADAPWRLVEALGEDELVQITERSNVPGYRPLARALASGLLETFEPSLHRNRSNVLREAMKRVVRWLPMLRPEALDPEGLDDFVFQLFSDTIVGLGYDPPVRVRQGTPGWLEVSLDRRFQFLAALTPPEVQRLSPLRDVHLHAWGEIDTRWTLLHRLSAPVAEIVAAVSAATQRRILEVVQSNAGLGAWLSEVPAGSWSRRVEPERGYRFIQAVDADVLLGIRARQGWPGVPARPSEVRREFLRRYGGEWEAVVSALPEDEPERLAAVLGVPEGLPLGQWLCGDALPVASEPPPPIEMPLLAAEPTASPAPPLPADAGPSPLSPADPIPEPPGLIRSLIEALGVATVGDLLRLDPEHPPDIPHLTGRKKLDALWAFRAELAERAAPPPAGGRFPTLAELEQAVLATLNERDRDVIELRVVRMASWEQVAETHDLSRPRVGHIVHARGEAIRREFGSEVERLLRTEAGFGIRGDTLCRDLAAGATVPFERLRLLAWCWQRDWDVEPDTLTLNSTHEHFDTLAALETAALVSVTERERDAFERRLVQHEPWSVIADAHGVSTGRIRQIVERAGERLRARLGREAERLLRAECGYGALGTHALHRDLARDATVPFERLALVAELFRADWAPDGDWLVLHRKGLPGLQGELEVILDGRRRLNSDDLRSIAVDSRFPVDLTGRLLALAGWGAALDGAITAPGPTPG